jgi:hypothetical protein
MVDMYALMSALPISDLEPDLVASIGGLLDAPKDQSRQYDIFLLEQPAGQRVPYIDPMQAWDVILRGRGLAEDAAKAKTIAFLVRMKANLKESLWVRFSTPSTQSPLNVFPFLTLSPAKNLSRMNEKFSHAYHLSSQSVPTCGQVVH